MSFSSCTFSSCIDCSGFFLKIFEKNDCFGSSLASFFSSILSGIFISLTIASGSASISSLGIISCSCFVSSTAFFGVSLTAISGSSLPSFAAASAFAPVSFLAAAFGVSSSIPCCSSSLMIVFLSIGMCFFSSFFFGGDSAFFSSVFFSGVCFFSSLCFTGASSASAFFSSAGAGSSTTFPSSSTFLEKMEIALFSLSLRNLNIFDELFQV